MKIKKRTLKIFLLALLLMASVYFFYKWYNKDPYQFEGNALYYSTHRGKPKYEISLLSKNDSFEIYKINFETRNFLDYKTKIFGLLFMPNKGNVPGIVLLPGGGVKKEEERAAPIIAQLGYAVLTFDQRGIGETNGYYLNFEDDYQIFKQGKEPIQHLSVYDALRAFDVLRQVKNVDKNNIAIAGESMGGRYAIIAAAVDKRIKGFIGISTVGFHVKDDPTVEYSNYLISVDPDHYIDKISPRPVFMLHGTNDTTVPLDSAKITFNVAKEPKEFFIAQDCGHGYCDKMKEELEKALRTIFKK